MAKFTKKIREEIETLIYKVFDTLDSTGTNTEHYSVMFSKMSDKRFLDYLKKTKWPFRFHTVPFDVEPTVDDCHKASNIIGFKLFDKVALPHIHQDRNGNPVVSNEAMIIDIPIKRMQQIVSKKTSTPSDITKRDMKTGVLLSDDKGAKTSDREMEALVFQGLDSTAKEMGRHKADYRTPKNIMYNAISTTGTFSLEDAPTNPEDSMARNYMNVYMLSAQLYTNLLNEEGYLAWTLKNKKSKGLEMR
jgi:hypothetical protein